MIFQEAVQELAQLGDLRGAELQPRYYRPIAFRERLHELAGAGAELAL